MKGGLQINIKNKKGKRMTTSHWPHLYPGSHQLKTLRSNNSHEDKLESNFSSLNHQFINKSNILPYM